MCSMKQQTPVLHNLVSFSFHVSLWYHAMSWTADDSLAELPEGMKIVNRLLFRSMLVELYIQEKQIGFA
jgi:hypothetical protein